MGWDLHNIMCWLPSIVSSVAVEILEKCVVEKCAVVHELKHKAATYVNAVSNHIYHSRSPINRDKFIL